MSSISTSFRGGRISRREALHVGALGALGLALPQLLRAEATRSGPREMSCILIFPFGGPATQDILDLKPDAPAEVRGEFQPIATSAPGIRIAEHLPKLAQAAQLFSIVRSVSHSQTDHDPAAHYVLTGGRQKMPGFPATGSVLSLLRPTERTLPSYALLPANLVNVKGVVGGQHAGFLGAVHNPFVIAGDPSQPRFQVPNLSPAHDVDFDRLAARRALLDNIDARAQHLGHTVAGQNLGGYYERAYDLVSSSQAKQARSWPGAGQEPRPLWAHDARPEHAHGSTLGGGGCTAHIG